METSPRIMVMAGEASGDAHAAKMVNAFKKRRPDAEMYGVGGPALRSEGVRLIRDVTELSTFGIFEVFRQIPRLAGVFLDALASISRERPDVVVLVDYPDFNIRFARAIRWRYGSKPLILYYIAPQVWIWRRRRARTLAKLADRLAVVLPFEKKLFENLGARVHFVGHPLVGAGGAEGSCPKVGSLASKGARKIALMPGSRRGELKNYMPPMMKAVEMLRKSGGKWEFFIIKAPTLDENDFAPYLVSASPGIKIASGPTRKTLEVMDFAVVALGTATLEAALVQTPALIVGKVSPLTYKFGIHFLDMDLDYYSLVNFILGRPAFPELIQGKCTGHNIAAAIVDITSSERAMEALRKAGREVRAKLAVTSEASIEESTASERAAAILEEMITESRG